MKILKKAWVNANDLNETQLNNFMQHLKNKENICILTKNGNLEYKILNYKNNIFNLEFTGRIVV